jgi:hypothetical protein
MFAFSDKKIYKKEYFQFFALIYVLADRQASQEKITSAQVKNFSS